MVTYRDFMTHIRNFTCKLLAILINGMNIFSYNTIIVEPYDQTLYSKCYKYQSLHRCSRSYFHIQISWPPFSSQLSAILKFHPQLSYAFHHPFSSFLPLASHLGTYLVAPHLSSACPSLMDQQFQLHSSKHKQPFQLCNLSNRTP